MVEVSAEFWRLTATISATMIGLVFVGTFYYLETGWKVVEFFRSELEAITVGYAKIIIAYFSVSLLLSLFQESFVFPIFESASFLFLAAVSAYVTRGLNIELEGVQEKLQLDIYRSLRVANWLLWLMVFFIPLALYNVLVLFDSGITSLAFIPNIIFAWVVLVSLIVGYWNLIQFLLTPHQFHKQERERKDRENKLAIREHEDLPNDTWTIEQQTIAEGEMESALEEAGLSTTTNFDTYSTHLSHDQLSGDLSEPKLRWPPDVSEVGEAMVHVVIPDEWYSDGDLLNRATQLAYHISIITRDAYQDLTGVEIRIWRTHVLPWDESRKSDMILKIRWRNHDMSALSDAYSNYEDILDSASDVLIDSTLFPRGLTEEDFDPAEREPEEGEAFSIYEVRDVSHAMAKRHVAKIVIQPGLDKSEIRDLLPELVDNIRKININKTDGLNGKWEDAEAHVVWLDLFSESRKPQEMLSMDSFEHFVCKAEWFDRELDPEYAPSEMTDYDEVKNGIRIKWASSNS